MTEILKFMSQPNGFLFYFGPCIHVEISGSEASHRGGSAIGGVIWANGRSHEHGYDHGRGMAMAMAMAMAMSLARAWPDPWPQPWHAVKHLLHMS